MDPFAADTVTVYVSEIVTSSWDEDWGVDWVRTSRVSAQGEVIGYRVTDCVGTVEAFATFPNALVGHATFATAFAEAAADMSARNFWTREALLMRVAADY